MTFSPKHSPHLQAEAVIELQGRCSWQCLMHCTAAETAIVGVTSRCSLYGYFWAFTPVKDLLCRSSKLPSEPKAACLCNAGKTIDEPATSCNMLQDMLTDAQDKGICFRTHGPAHADLENLVRAL